MKTIDKILHETHAHRNYNYEDIRSAFGLFREELIKELIPLIIAPKQLEMYNQLVKSPAVETGTIARRLNMPSKNVSSQLTQLMKRTNLIGFERIGKLKYWYKK